MLEAEVEMNSQWLLFLVSFLRHIFGPRPKSEGMVLNLVYG